MTMKRIRLNVFETNSSSVHTISISKEGLVPSELKISKDGYIHVDFGKFGKDLCYYDSQYEKLQYLITCLYYCVGYDVKDIYDDYQFEEIQDAVCKYTGAKGIIIDNQTDPEIDHQSQPEYGEISIINCWSEEEVTNFIFNRFISLKTDCD